MSRAKAATTRAFFESRHSHAAEEPQESTSSDAQTPAPTLEPFSLTKGLRPKRNEGVGKVAHKFIPDQEYAADLSEIGAVLGVSRERVRQIQERALKKCRLWCKDHGMRLEDLLPAVAHGGGEFKIRPPSPSPGD